MWAKLFSFQYVMYYNFPYQLATYQSMVILEVMRNNNPLDFPSLSQKIFECMDVTNPRKMTCNWK